MSVLIDKDKFVNIISELKEEDKYLDKLYKLRVNVFEKIASLSNVVELLEILMHDKTHTISWWCWEKDFGQKQYINAYDENDDVVKLNTAEELYDFLASNCK